MKRILLLSTWSAFSALAVQAQAPQAFEFQGVARNVAGDVLFGQAIALRLSIVQTTAGGTVVYQERHTPTTSSHGLFVVNVGNGTVLSGTFGTIGWGSNTYFLKVEMDPVGGTTYTVLGTTQLLSVPYAMYANSTNAWGLNGTAAGASNFIGTTNMQPFIIKVDGIRAAFLSAGSANASFGHEALNPAVTGVENTAIGTRALMANTSGSQNTAVGRYALAANTTGHYNTAVGNIAMANTTGGVGNTAVGFNSLWPVQGSHNTAVGMTALALNTTGAENAAMGAFALSVNTASGASTAVGYGALRNNTAAGSTAVGHEALLTNTSGVDNTAVGFHALRLSTGVRNSALGSEALLINSTGGDNSAFGAGALANSTAGSGNTAMGSGAATANTAGNSNTAIGKSANAQTTTGSSNTGVGVQALYYNSTGSYNCALGLSAGPQLAAPNVSNSTSLGFGTITDFSNQIHLGNNLITQIGGYEPWSDLSDIRFKKDVEPQTHGLDFILRLEPISYHMDVRKLNTFLYAGGDTLFDSEFFQQAIRDKEARLYSGFSAQQVEQAAAEVGYEFSGVYAPQGERDHYALAYSTFVVPLVRAVQELHARNEALGMENSALKNEMDQLRALVLSALPASTTATVRSHR